MITQISDVKNSENISLIFDKQEVNTNSHSKYINNYQYISPFDKCSFQEVKIHLKNGKRYSSNTKANNVLLLCGITQY